MQEFLGDFQLAELCEICYNKIKEEEIKMKKLWIIGLTVLTLCGCSTKNSQTVCKGKINGQDAEVHLDFDGEDLTNVAILFSVEAGSEDGAEMAKTVLEGQKETLLAQLGDGSDMTCTVNGTKVDMEITIDVVKAGENLNYDNLNFSGVKEEVIQAMEDSGLTCQ